MPERPLVYLILGAAGSGRREIVSDLMEGEPGSDAWGILLAEGEAPDARDEHFGSAGRWRRTDDGRIEGELPPGAKKIFFLAHGRLNPVDQIEAFKFWLESEGAELARILTVVDCRRAERHPPLLVWYDACVHFSDVVLLHHREGVANKWISGFRARYKDQCYPCLIELTKSGRVRNPVLILEPRALRISHAFDDEVEWVPDEEEEDGDEVEVHPAEDPYFARLAGGRRAKEIPDINKYV